jgi:hypothetical protein
MTRTRGGLRVDLLQAAAKVEGMNHRHLERSSVGVGAPDSPNGWLDHTRKRSVSAATAACCKAHACQTSAAQVRTLQTGHAAIQRQVQPDQGVGDRDGPDVAADLAPGVLRGVGIHGQLVVVAHQLDVVQLEALHLANELPALRRGVPARVPR